MSNISFVGKLRKIKDGYTEQEFAGGLMRRRLRFQAICGDSVQYLEVAALVWKDDKKNKVYTLKEVEGSKPEKMTVAWSDRLNPNIIETVPGYKRFVIDTDTTTHRNSLKDAGDDAEYEKSMKKRKEFIHESDMIDYLIKVLDSEKSKDMVFRINGAIEYSWGSNKDIYYRTFVPQKIWRVDDNIEQNCSGSMKLYFTENAVDDTMVEDIGDYMINAFVSYYDQNIKSNAFAPIMVKINKDHKMANGFVKRFSKAADGEVKELGVTVDFINGSPSIAITEDMLSDEQRDAIADGLCTFEDIKRELGGNVKGDRVQEIRLTGLMRGYATSGVQDTVFEAEALYKKPIKEDVVAEKTKTDTNDEEDLDLPFDEDDEI